MDAPQWRRRLSWSIVGLVVALMMIGWVGIARAEALAGGDGRFLRRQIVWGIVALAAMFAATLPSYRLLARWSYAAFFAALVLLAAVYLFPPINGRSVGSVLDRWDCSRRSLPSWRSCWALRAI